MLYSSEIAGLDLNLAGPSQLQQSGLLLSEAHGSGHKRQRTSNDDDDPTGEPRCCVHAHHGFRRTYTVANIQLFYRLQTALIPAASAR